MIMQYKNLDAFEKPLTFQEALRLGESFLNECEITDAAVDAWLLLEHVTGMGRTRFLLERGREMQETFRKTYAQLLGKRGTHIPLQHLTGVQEFMGLEFLVNEHVLIPRQDTEILVEEAQKQIRPGMRILDLCTGSGCIGISLAKLWPGGCLTQRDLEQSLRAGKTLAVSVDCADISLEALKTAGENAVRLETPVCLIHSDLFRIVDEQDAAGEHRAEEALTCDKMAWKKGLLGRYDMIVSNPPYIRTSVIEELSEEVRLHEPFGALDGKEDGLYFYRKIIRESRAHLTEEGRLLFEIGYDQGEAVSQLMKEQGFIDVQVIKDLAGLDRVVCGRLEKN